MLLEGRAKPVKPLVGRLGAEHDALRVAEVQDDDVDGFTRGVERHVRHARGKPHGGAEGRTSIGGPGARHPLWTRGRRDRDRRAVAVVVEQQQRRERPHAVAGDLGAPAVRIEQLHRRARGRPAVDDQAVRADAGMALAHLARERRQIDACDVAPVDVKEVVAVRMGLGESNHRQKRRRRPTRTASGGWMAVMSRNPGPVTTRSSTSLPMLITL